MNRKFIKYPGKAVTAAESSDVFVWDGMSAVPKDVVRVKVQEGVTEISYRAFYYHKDLVDVHFPSSLTSIGKDAFLWCTNLRSVTFPSGLTSIGEFAFAYCGSLDNVIIPDSVKSIGSDVFTGCANLTRVTLGRGIKSIPSAAFGNCKNLTSVSFPDTLTSVGSFAFCGCEALSRIDLPNSLRKLGECAFVNCKMLSEVNMPPDVKMSSEVFEGTQYEMKQPATRQSSTNTIRKPDSAVNIEVLSDLIQSSYESWNLELGNSAGDLEDWEDAVYTDASYRECIAETALSEISELQDAKLSQVDISWDDDADTSELLCSISIDGNLVGTIRSWYIRGRFDATLE